MFVDRLLNQGSAPLLEQVVHFAAQRHKLIAENIANVDTPDYRQKDLSVGRFHKLLRERAAERRSAPPGSLGYDGLNVDVENPVAGILFHDQNNRSMEHLASEQAKNGLLYTLAIELLNKQFSSMQAALRERVG